MSEASRRELLLGAGAFALGAALYTKPAHATLVRGLSLPALVAQSERILVLEPLDSVSRYAEIGGRKCIVTDTQTRVHDSWSNGAETELVLRTLGGRLDGMGELVHGQPVLELGVYGVTFLKLSRDRKVWWTIGMAQGHFPLSATDESALLRVSRGLPHMLNVEGSAVKRLVGRRVGEARSLVQSARAE